MTLEKPLSTSSKLNSELTEHIYGYELKNDCPNEKEILQYGKYGFLVKTGDYKNLGLTMAKALNTKNKTISSKNLKKVNSLEIITSKYSDLFLNLNEK